MSVLKKGNIVLENKVAVKILKHDFFVDTCFHFSWVNEIAQS